MLETRRARGKIRNSIHICSLWVNPIQGLPNIIRCSYSCGYATGIDGYLFSTYGDGDFLNIQRGGEREHLQGESRGSRYLG